MSHATENPVYCAMKDEGCTASHPSGRWGNQKASNEGWFASREEQVSYCPQCLPDWVPAWRARQAALKFEVAGTVAVSPGVLKCTGCELEESTADEPSADTLTELRAKAFEHGKTTGHAVTVTTRRVLTVEPA